MSGKGEFQAHKLIEWHERFFFFCPEDTFCIVFELLPEHVPIYYTDIIPAPVLRLIYHFSNKSVNIAGDIETHLE